MAKKTWIKIHTGLVEDPKHADSMGEKVWLFMYLVNRADYSTGIVTKYKDRIAAIEMSRPQSTIRKWRTALSKAGYIICHAGFQCLNIRIMRWLDPRETNPQQVNIPDQKDTWCPILDTHGTTLLGTHPFTQMDTPTLDSQESQSFTGENGSTWVFQLYTDIFKETVTSGEHDDLRELASVYVQADVKEAMKIAKSKNDKHRIARKVAYTKGILEDWAANGKPEIVKKNEGTPIKPRTVIR